MYPLHRDSTVLPKFDVIRCIAKQSNASVIVTNESKPYSPLLLKLDLSSRGGWVKYNVKKTLALIGQFFVLTLIFYKYFLALIKANSGTRIISTICNLESILIIL